MMPSWRASSWAFLVWNVVFAVLAVTPFFIDWCEGPSGSTRTACAVGYGLGLAFLYVGGFIVWAVGAVVLTVVWFATSPRPIESVGAIVLVGLAGAGLAVPGFVRLKNSLDADVFDVTGAIIGGLIIAVGLGLTTLAVRQLRRMQGRRASGA